jgi:hypothetical protein
MTLQLSVSVRNAMLDAIETTIGTSAKLEVFTGAIPANCATADSGTKLASATLPSDWMAAAASGQKGLSGTWQDSSADASGYAGYYRIKDSAGTTCHEQGLVSQTWQAATAYALNQQVDNGGNVYKCTTAGTSAGSGGPTGTGSGITDNTAVWQYLGTKDMGIDNTNFATGQNFTVTSYTFTAPNA